MRPWPLCRHSYRKDKLSIYTQYIPQILFMMAIFGYLDILIIAKWCGAALTVRGDNCARSLLISKFTARRRSYQDYSEWENTVHKLLMQD